MRADTPYTTSLDEEPYGAFDSELCRLVTGRLSGVAVDDIIRALQTGNVPWLKQFNQGIDLIAAEVISEDA